MKYALLECCKEDKYNGKGRFICVHLEKKKLCKLAFLYLSENKMIWLIKSET